MIGLLSFIITNYSGDNRGGNTNTAAVAVGVVIPIVSMILLLLGTGIIIAIKVKNKPRQPHYEGISILVHTHIMII